MNYFVGISLVFIVGCSLGWLLELFFRRIVHKKWINPGFLVGPCLPLYGTGLTFLYLVSSINLSFISSEIVRAVVVILLLGILMTLVEYITGLVFIKKMKVKLWDYSSRPGNIQGIICPLFSFFWLVIAAIYYLFIHKYIIYITDFINNYPIYAYFVGMYFGVMGVDVFYSFQIVSKIRAWAKENNYVIKYEELKESIRAKAIALKQKRHFIFSFKTKNCIDAELEHYKQNDLKK